MIQKAWQSIGQGMSSEVSCAEDKKCYTIHNNLLLAFANLYVEHGNNGFTFTFPSQPFWTYKQLEVFKITTLIDS